MAWLKVFKIQKLITKKMTAFMISISFIFILIGIYISNLSYFLRYFHIHFNTPLYESTPIDKPLSSFLIVFGSAFLAIWWTENTLGKHYDKLEELQNQNKELQSYNKIQVYPIIRTSGEFGMCLAQSILFIPFNGTIDSINRCLELAKRINIYDLEDLTNEFLKEQNYLVPNPQSYIDVFLEKHLYRIYRAFKDIYGESIADSFRLSFSLVIMQHDILIVTDNHKSAGDTDIEKASDSNKNIIPTLEKIGIDKDVANYLIREFKLFEDRNHIITNKDAVNKFIELTLKYLQELDPKNETHKSLSNFFRKKYSTKDPEFLLYAEEVLNKLS